MKWVEDVLGSRAIDGAMECRPLHGSALRRSQRLLDDPWRNGVVLCAIAAVLCPGAALQPPHRRPSTVAAARENVACALEAFRLLLCGTGNTDGHTGNNDFTAGAVTLMAVSPEAIVQGGGGHEHL